MNYEMKSAVYSSNNQERFEAVDNIVHKNNQVNDVQPPINVPKKRKMVIKPPVDTAVTTEIKKIIETEEHIQKK